MIGRGNQFVATCRMPVDGVSVGHGPRREGPKAKKPKAVEDYGTGAGPGFAWAESWKTDLVSELTEFSAIWKPPA